MSSCLSTTSNWLYNRTIQCQSTSIIWLVSRNNLVTNLERSRTFQKVLRWSSVFESVHDFSRHFFKSLSPLPGNLLALSALAASVRLCNWPVDFGAAPLIREREPLVILWSGTFAAWDIVAAGKNRCRTYHRYLFAQWCANLYQLQLLFTLLHTCLWVFP